MDMLLPTPLERPVHLTLGRVLPLYPPAIGGRFELRRLPLWNAAPRLSLQVLRGAVWLTWPGCEADLFLRAGQTVLLPPPAWGSPLGTIEGVLVEAEPRLSLMPAVVRLVGSGPSLTQRLESKTTARLRPWRLAS